MHFFSFFICSVSKYWFVFVWKANNSKFWKKLYLWMIFICVHLNLLHLHECQTMTLKGKSAYLVFCWSDNLQTGGDVHSQKEYLPPITPKINFVLRRLIISRPSTDNRTTAGRILVFRAIIGRFSDDWSPMEIKYILKQKSQNRFGSILIINITVLIIDKSWLLKFAYTFTIRS